MSTRATARFLGAHLRALTPDRRVRWKELIKYLVRGYFWAWRELPPDVLLAIGSEAMALAIKAKAGLAVEKSMNSALAEEPELAELVREVREEIDHERGNKPRLELGSGGSPVVDSGRSAGEGPAAAAAAAGDAPLETGDGGRRPAAAAAGGRSIARRIFGRRS